MSKYEQVSDVEKTTDARPPPTRGELRTTASKARKIWQCSLLLGLTYIGLCLFRARDAFWVPCTANKLVGHSPGVAQLPTHYKLPSGDEIPAIALGVWQASPGEVGEAVKAALKAGYRHIDGAYGYGNEAEVGVAIKESGVPREDIWITSKLPNTLHHSLDIEPTLDESLAKLQMSYVDLYLIHWPIAFDKNKTVPGQKPVIDYDLTNNPIPTWKKLEELVKKGKVRNIGVSNFNIERLRKITDGDISIFPSVNQVELNFWNPQPNLVKWSKENGILLEAYSPLGSTKYVSKSLNVPEVKEVAKELGITPSQVLISWHNQRGYVVLPKSVHPSRIEENLQVFELPPHAFNKIETAATSHEPKRLSDPSKNWGIDVFGDEK